MAPDFTTGGILAFNHCERQFNNQIYVINYSGIEKPLIGHVTTVNK